MAQQHRPVVDTCRPVEKPWQLNSSTADLHEDEGIEDHGIVALLALCHVVLMQSLSPAGARKHSIEEFAKVDAQAASRQGARRQPTPHHKTEKLRRQSEQICADILLCSGMHWHHALIVTTMA